MIYQDTINSYSPEIVKRIKDLSAIHGFDDAYMAAANEISVDKYCAYMNGELPLSYALILTCAQVFNVDIGELMGGEAPNLSSITVTRAGEGMVYHNPVGDLMMCNVASKFKNRLIQPVLVTAKYDHTLDINPVQTTTHYGQECDYVIKGQLKVRHGDRIEILGPGDSIYFDSDVPHGIIATGGQDCEFFSVMVSPEEIEFTRANSSVPTLTATRETGSRRVWDNFITPIESNGTLQSISFKNEKSFNFAFDIVDAIAEKAPDKLALVHIDDSRVERRFTFKDIARKSGRAANYFKSIGIGKGDRVMLVMKRSWQFWPIMIALEKVGAIAVPVIDQLVTRDFVYRFTVAGISAVISVADETITGHIDSAAKKYGRIKTKVCVGGEREGWFCFDKEYDKHSARFLRTSESICGEDLMFMVFQSASEGMPVPACHNCMYPLAHFVTGYYWNCDNPDSLHFTVSDTAWVRALWGKLFGPWICETPVFTYDFDKLQTSYLLELISKYEISSFSAPAALFRALLSEDLSAYDLSCLKHVSSVGDVLDSEVFTRFREATGLSIMSGFGLTETSLIIGTFVGMTPKPDSVGKANPIYDIRLLDPDGNEVETGEPGEICISLRNGHPIGLFTGFFNGNRINRSKVSGDYFHTGDLAWQDEDGYYYAIGRTDDVIKCSGYRIGPFEVEKVILELPYVLECGVSAVPDETRGQVVKASIVLIEGKEPSEDLKIEIQEYVKTHTAAYRYPRVVEFRKDLPKSNNGVIIRSKL